MKVKHTPLSNLTRVVVLLGLLEVFLVFSSLTGHRPPLFSSDKAILVVMIFVGMVMCTTGIGKVAANGAWSSPLAITGYVLGGLILFIGVAALAGWQFLLVMNEQQAIVDVGVLLLVKLVLSSLHSLIMKPKTASRSN